MRWYIASETVWGGLNFFPTCRCGLKIGRSPIGNRAQDEILPVHSDRMSKCPNSRGRLKIGRNVDTSVDAARMPGTPGTDPQIGGPQTGSACATRMCELPACIIRYGLRRV